MNLILREGVFVSDGSVEEMKPGVELSLPFAEYDHTCSVDFWSVGCFPAAEAAISKSDVMIIHNKMD
jgi:hypothetical protein